MGRLSRAIVAVLCLPGVLNSCYFNSTARLYDLAEYEARAEAADLNKAPNPVVYQNGSSYFIELPRYRYGTPLRLHRTVFDQEQTPSPSLEARGTGMYRIPEALALYLTGQGGQMNEMFSLEEVPEAEEIKQLSRRMPVVKRVVERQVSYTYHSPDAAWLRVAAPFNWLLVDVPVTVAENAAMLAGVAGVIWLLAEVDDDDCDDCHHHGHRHHHH